MKVLQIVGGQAVGAEYADGGVAELVGDGGKDVADDFGGAVYDDDVLAEGLLDADVFAGGVADYVVAVKDAEVGGLAAHFLQHFAGAVGGAAVDRDDFGGTAGGMAQHSVDAAAHILGVAVGVEDESEIATGGFVQARRDFAGR